MNMDEYVGIPWLERGRDRDGLDCWGLLSVIFAERFGISLPNYRDDYTTTADAVTITGLIDGHMDDWLPVEAGNEREGDGLLMSISGRPRHVGLVVAPGYVLHIETGAGSLIESYRSARLRSRVVGFYRHRLLA